MQVLIHTDHHIEGHEGLVAWATSTVQSALSHQKDHITRVEVHLSDENGAKSGQADKRCVMEARLQGRPPLAATQHADNQHQAITGAADKLTRLIASTLGKADRGKTLSEKLQPDVEFIEPNPPGT